MGMEQITLTVSGMSCQGCADSLSRAFVREEGVSTAAVSFETSKAEVNYHADKITPEQLNEIVETAGFSVD